MEGNVAESKKKKVLFYAFDFKINFSHAGSGSSGSTREPLLERQEKFAMGDCKHWHKAEH